MGHDDGGGYASMNRPDMAKTPEAQRLAARLMKGLVCMCGGCNRENLHDCKCKYASDMRAVVLAKVDKGESYDQVVDDFVKIYGGNEDVLNEPQDKLAWILPYVAILGGLALVLVLGTRWVRRGRALAPVAPTGAAVQDADDEYAEKLDDELRDID